MGSTNRYAPWWIYEDMYRKDLLGWEDPLSEWAATSRGSPDLKRSEGKAGLLLFAYLVSVSTLLLLLPLPFFANIGTQFLLPFNMD